MRIDAVEVHDVRFPTSRTLAGSDAMNPDPDYSAAYVVLRTDDGPDGHGLAFTIGRGNEVCVAAVKALEPLVVGSSVKAVLGDLGGFWRTLTGDSQLRWIGPEKGAIHLATAAVVNAAWDLAAKTAGKPLWRYLADLGTDEILDVIPFAYLEDALTPNEARELLERAGPGREDRERQLLAEGYPAYTTSAGWLGYSDAQVRQLATEALDKGFDHLKLKVGRDLEDDLRRGRVLRGLLGPDRILSLDANQRWGVPEAIRWIEDLRSLDPYWIEEPTSPDDVLGHATIARAVAPIRVATGEHVHNRVMFKQLLASGAIDVCQIDACRLGGVNEVLAVLLLAAKAGVPVCPHAGGVGLCEMVQHLSMFDFLRVSGSTDGRWIEYVDHLHQHFVDPVMVRDGRYQAPSRPGYSTELYPTSVAQHRFPDGSAWREAVAQ